MMSNSIKSSTFSKIQVNLVFLIEETLIGEEISVIALCNKNSSIITIARDYKRHNNGQTGQILEGWELLLPVELPEKRILGPS